MIRGWYIIFNIILIFFITAFIHTHTITYHHSLDALITDKWKIDPNMPATIMYKLKSYPMIMTKVRHQMPTFISKKLNELICIRLIFIMVNQSISISIIAYTYFVVFLTSFRCNKNDDTIQCVYSEQSIQIYLEEWIKIRRN